MRPKFVTRTEFRASISESRLESELRTQVRVRIQNSDPSSLRTLVPVRVCQRSSTSPQTPFLGAARVGELAAQRTWIRADLLLSGMDLVQNTPAVCDGFFTGSDEMVLARGVPAPVGVAVWLEEEEAKSNRN